MDCYDCGCSVCVRSIETRAKQSAGCDGYELKDSGNESSSSSDSHYPCQAPYYRREPCPRNRSPWNRNRSPSVEVARMRKQQREWKEYHFGRIRHMQAVKVRRERRLRKKLEKGYKFPRLEVLTTLLSFLRFNRFCDSIM